MIIILRVSKIPYRSIRIPRLGGEILQGKAFQKRQLFILVQDLRTDFGGFQIRTEPKEAAVVVVAPKGGAHAKKAPPLCSESAFCFKNSDSRKNVQGDQIT